MRIKPHAIHAAIQRSDGSPIASVRHLPIGENDDDIDKFIDVEYRRHGGRLKFDFLDLNHLNSPILGPTGHAHFPPHSRGSDEKKKKTSATASASASKNGTNDEDDHANLEPSCGGKCLVCVKGTPSPHHFHPTWVQVIILSMFALGNSAVTERDLANFIATHWHILFARTQQPRPCVSSIRSTIVGYLDRLGNAGIISESGADGTQWKLVDGIDPFSNANHVVVVPPPSSYGNYGGGGGGSYNAHARALIQPHFQINPSALVLEEMMMSAFHNANDRHSANHGGSSNNNGASNNNVTGVKRSRGRPPNRDGHLATTAAAALSRHGNRSSGNNHGITIVVDVNGKHHDDDDRNKGDDDDDDDDDSNDNDDDNEVVVGGSAAKKAKKQLPVVSAKEKAASKSGQRCAYCGTTMTVLWRQGPSGRGTLCNACGIKWKRGILQLRYAPTGVGGSKEPVLISVKKRKSVTIASGAGGGEDDAVAGAVGGKKMKMMKKSAMKREGKAAAAAAAAAAVAAAAAADDDRDTSMPHEADGDAGDDDAASTSETCDDVAAAVADDKDNSSQQQQQQQPQ